MLPDKEKWGSAYACPSNWSRPKGESLTSYLTHMSQTEAPPSSSHLGSKSTNHSPINKTRSSRAIILPNRSTIISTNFPSEVSPLSLTKTIKTLTLEGTRVTFTE